MRILKFNEELGSSGGPKRPQYDYEKIKSDFDDVVNILLDVTDEFDQIILRFETACGSRVFMYYDSYVRKDDKYDKFIEALPIMGEFFTVSLSFKPMNYEQSLIIGEAMKSTVSRICDLKWKFKEFKITGSDSTYASSFLEYEFSRKEEKHYNPLHPSNLDSLDLE